MDNNDKEKDIFIKYNLSKHNEVPEKIDNLFNNFVKEEERMKEEKIVKEESEKKSKIKWPMYKKALGFAACFTILFAGAHIYATSQGYDNIFFLIKHVAEGGKVTDKNEILSDRDITISYNSIDIGKGIKLQVNKLTVKDNEAKLYLVVDIEKASEEINKMNFKVISDNKILCDETMKNEEQTDVFASRFEKELVLKDFKEDTKILNLCITANNLELSTLKINLETKEIEVDGEKELEKISEIELKKYLSAFALLDYDIAGDHNSYESNNERKLLVAGALKREMFNKANTQELAYFEIDEMNELVQSFTEAPMDNGIIKTENWLFSLETKNGKQYYKFNQMDGYPTAICLSVDDITYENGLYSIKYTYCYPTMNDYASDNIENIDRYTNTIKLKINTNTEYSKYYIEEIGIGKLVKGKEKTEETNNSTNNTTNNTQSTPTPASTSTNDIDVSKIDNYTTSMNWGQYRSAGLKVTYPTDFTITETTNPNKGNSSGELYATISGTAVGKENGEITRSDMTIEFYEPETYTKEQLDYLENSKPAGTITSNKTGKTWYRIEGVATLENSIYCEEYVSRVGLNREDGSDVVVKVVFKYSIPSYKVTNIMNYMLGELRSASY
ncbi:MAG: hypothetical protein IKG42_03960 [Clostridia bacterium]|nr:hypothetical protein [Clostridia bacterium]